MRKKHQPKRRPPKRRTVVTQRGWQRAPEATLDAAAAVDAVRAATADILARQQARRDAPEVPGLLQRDLATGAVIATVCHGNPAVQRRAAPPFCAGRRLCAPPQNALGGARPGAEQRAAHVVVGEFHTHPPSGGRWSPPSGADLFQLVLSAALGRHNCSVIVSAEGDYVCRASPAAARRLLDDVAQFYADVGALGPDEIERALTDCRQPVPELLRPYAARNGPDGAGSFAVALLDRPYEWFLEGRDPAAFANACQRHLLGLVVRFFPRAT